MSLDRWLALSIFVIDNIDLSDKWELLKKFLFFYFYFSFIFISWRLITSQHFSGFCHTLTWINHGVTCIPHPNPPSHLPLHPIPLGFPFYKFTVFNHTFGSQQIWNILWAFTVINYGHVMMPNYRKSKNIIICIFISCFFTNSKK